MRLTIRWFEVNLLNKKCVSLEITVSALSFFLPQSPKILFALPEQMKFHRTFKASRAILSWTLQWWRHLFQIFRFRAACSHSLTSFLPVCFHKLTYSYCKDCFWFWPKELLNCLWTHSCVWHLAVQGSSSTWCQTTLTVTTQWFCCYCGKGEL